MKVITVYSRYYYAHSEYNSMLRKAVEVKLTSTYDDGNIKYDVSVNFFPFNDPNDFVETFDAFAAKEIYNAEGRRSKKREAAFIDQLCVYADEAAKSIGGVVYWDKPITEPRLG